MNVTSCFDCLTSSINLKHRRKQSLRIDLPPNVVLLFYSGLLFSSHEVVIIEMLLINPVEGHGWLPEPAVTQAWDLIRRRQGGKRGKTHLPNVRLFKQATLLVFSQEIINKSCFKFKMSKKQKQTKKVYKM